MKILHNIQYYTCIILLFECGWNVKMNYTKTLCSIYSIVVVLHIVIFCTYVHHNKIYETLGMCFSNYITITRRLEKNWIKIKSQRCIFQPIKFDHQNNKYSSFKKSRKKIKSLSFYSSSIRLYIIPWNIWIILNLIQFYF